MRIARPLQLLSVLSSLLLGGGASAVEAGGYWACVGSDWIKVGSPAYEQPIIDCAPRMSLPGTADACTSAGGTWGPIGIFPRPVCRMPTVDAGRTCGDDGECAGTCIADLSKQRRDRVIAGGMVRTLGRCTPARPAIGCLAVVKRGYVDTIICLD